MYGDSREEGKLDFQTDTPQDTIGIDHGRGFIDVQGPDRGQSVESLASLSMMAHQLPAQLESDELKHGTVDIKITDHFTKEDRFRDFTVYTLKGADSQGVIEITRRYSDFFLIRRYLLLKWPGCYIPPLPPKNMLKNMEAEFVKLRKIGLNDFLHKVANLPHLHYSKEFQLFLRSHALDLEKELKQHQRVYFDEVIQRYASTFQHLAQIPSVNDAAMVTARFKSFLYKALGRLKTFRNITKEVAKAKKKFYEGISVFQNHVMTEYERDIIGEYQNFNAPRGVFSDPNNQQQLDQVARMKTAIGNESLEHFDTWIILEYREIETLLEAIAQKEKYESYKSKTIARQKSLTTDVQEISTGQFNFKTIFTSKTKGELMAEMNEQIANCTKEIEQLTMLIDMISLVLAHIEIEKFKSHKSEKFYQLVDIAARNEIDNLTCMNEYWNGVLAKNGGQ